MADIDFTAKSVAINNRMLKREKYFRNLLKVKKEIMDNTSSRQTSSA